jgi:hypothetical protein
VRPVEVWCCVARPEAPVYDDGYADACCCGCQWGSRCEGAGGSMCEAVACRVPERRSSRPVGAAARPGDKAREVMLG